MMPKLLPLLAFPLPFLLPMTAHAIEYNFCLRVNTDLFDDNIGEDYGLGTVIDNVTYWRMRGARFRLYDPFGNRIGGSFLDESGCTGTFSTSSGSGFDFEFSSYGVLADGNELFVNSGVTGETVTYTVSDYNPPNTAGTYDILYSSNNDLPRIYAVYSYIINERFRGDFEDQLVTVWNGTNSPCGNTDSRMCGDDGDWHIQLAGQSNANRRKFLMGHEYGHVNLYASTGTKEFGGDCSFSGSGHGMATLEWQSCAAMEGWAHFAAVAAFNDRHESEIPDAWFLYWDGSNSVIDVSFGQNDPYPQNYCDNIPGNLCTGGKGYEVDWMRFLWDFWSHSGAFAPGEKPSSTSAMQDTFRTTWNRSNIYGQIWNEVGERFGEEQNDRMFYFTDVHGNWR